MQYLILINVMANANSRWPDATPVVSMGTSSIRERHCSTFPLITDMPVVHSPRTLLKGINPSCLGESDTTICAHQTHQQWNSSWNSAKWHQQKQLKKRITLTREPHSLLLTACLYILSYLTENCANSYYSYWLSV